MKFRCSTLVLTALAVPLKGAYIRTAAIPDVSGLFPCSPVNLHLLPHTYLVNLKPSSLFESRSFPIQLRVQRSDSGILDFDLDAVNKYGFRCAYDPQVGTVQWVRSSHLPSAISGAADEVQVEKKIVNVFNGLKSISYGGSHLQLLATGGDAVSFGLPTNTLPWAQAPESELRFDTSSYLVDNHPVQLFENLQPFPIVVHTRYVQEGIMDLIFRGINTYTYRVTYEPLLGTVTRVVRQSTATNIVGSAEQVAVEKKVISVLETLRSIHYDSRLVTFAGESATAGFLYGDNSLPQTVFPSDELHLLPYTYTVDSKPAVLYADTAFPFTARAQRVQNDIIDLNCRGFNTYKYRVHYNPTTRVVLKSYRTYATPQLLGTPEQLQSEQRILSVLDNVHTLDYNQNEIRVVSSPASSITFGVPSGRLPFCGSIRCDYTVNPSTYIVNSSPATFYTGSPFPLTMRAEYIHEGIMNLYFRGVNTYTYRIIYNPVERTVINVSRIGGGIVASSVQEQLAVETKVTQIVERLRSFAYDASTLTFQSDVGSLGWRLPSDQLSWDGSFGVEIRRVIPESYYFRGSPEPLFSSGFGQPLTLELYRESDGILNVAVRGVNTMKYRIHYNSVDGWVSNVEVGERTNLSGDVSVIEAETKIRNIIANVQQVVFDPEGTVRFITDNGSTRISCEAAAAPFALY